MSLVKSPVVISIKLLHQSRSSFTTVASLASERPKWKITEATNPSEAKPIANSSNFVQSVKEDARYQYSGAAFKDQSQLEDG